MMRGKKVSGVACRVSGLRFLVLLLLLAPGTWHPAPAFGQSQPYRVGNLSNIRFADGFPGSTATAKQDAAVTDIGSGPGIVVVPPGIGNDNATTYPNRIGILDLRQTTDIVGTSTTDPDRSPLFLIEHQLGDLEAKPLTGTVTLTNGSTAVTGVGTAFHAQLEVAPGVVHVGRSVKLNADGTTCWAEVSRVTDDTHATLAGNYPCAGGSAAASYAISHLTLGVHLVLTAGTPNTRASGDGVGFTVVGNRSGGMRPLFGMNSNISYSTKDANATAMALELDMTNNTGTDDSVSIHSTHALVIDSAGANRPVSGIYVFRSQAGGEFQRGLWIDNAFNDAGIFVKGATKHAVFQPTVDNSSPQLVGQNTALATVWSINNDGSASFTGPFRVGRGIVPGLNPVPFSSTPTFDASLGNTQKITLTGSVTSSTLANATTGETINFVICQDSTGTHTFVWPTNVKGGMTIGSTLSTCSAQSFIFDGSNAYALSAGMTNM